MTLQNLTDAKVGMILGFTYTNAKGETSRRVAVVESVHPCSWSARDGYICTTDAKKKEPRQFKNSGAQYVEVLGKPGDKVVLPSDMGIADEYKNQPATTLARVYKILNPKCEEVLGMDSYNVIVVTPPAPPQMTVNLSNNKIVFTFTNDEKKELKLEFSPTHNVPSFQPVEIRCPIDHKFGANLGTQLSQLYRAGLPV